MHPLDLAIIAGYLVFVLASGFWFGKRQNTTWRYFLASNDLPWWAIAASIVATETSTITFISIPGVIYAKGGNFGFLQLVFGYLLARVIISIFFMPRYFEGELVSVYQLLRVRFGARVKALAASLFITMRIVADGVRLLVTAYVLFAVLKSIGATGTPVTVCVIGLGVVMIVFSLVGGIEAIIWIEVFQLLIYLGGAAAAAWVLIGEVGLAQAVAAGIVEGKFKLFDFSFDMTLTMTFWSGIIGGTFLTLSTHGTDQFLVQRYLCTDKARNASKALLLSGLIVLVQFAAFLFIGVLLWVYYGGRQFVGTDTVFPDFIANHMPVGLAGLVVAGILAAAMSSSLNSIAATVVDLYRPYADIRDDWDDLMVSRGVTVVAGVAQIAVGILLQNEDRTALQVALAIASVINGPILGAFLLGMTRRAGPQSALSGMLVGLGVVAYVSFLTKVAWPWYAAIGAITTFVAGYLWPLSDEGESWE